MDHERPVGGVAHRKIIRAPQDLARIDKTGRDARHGTESDVRSRQSCIVRYEFAGPGTGNRLVSVVGQMGDGRRAKGG